MSIAASLFKESRYERRVGCRLYGLKTKLYTKRGLLFSSICMSLTIDYECIVSREFLFQGTKDDPMS